MGSKGLGGLSTSIGVLGCEHTDPITSFCHKSLNAFVEDVLYREVQTDMEGWPVLKNRIEPSEELRAMQVSRPFTAEEMAADDRLAYILSK